MAEHRLTNVDLEGRTADCEACGPGARIKVSVRDDGKVWRRCCRSKFKREASALRRAEAHPDWHQITNADAEFNIGDCSVCGSGVPVRRRGQGYRCGYGKWKGRGLPMRVTADELRATLQAADGKCTLCQQAKVLRRDHDHETGQFRGWLCVGCNSALGALGDSPERLRRVVAYLEGGLSQGG